MRTSPSRSDWRDALPLVRGRIARDIGLAPFTWFRVGGPADLLFRPADEDDLATFVTSLPAEVPLTVIGAGSNLLVRDGGVRGAVVRLGTGFAGITVETTTIEAGAAALDHAVARHAAQAEIGGLEFLSGIPGTIGGAVRMNAGAFGTEMREVTRRVRAIDRAGTRHEIDADGLDFGYRRCALPEDWIVLAATLAGRPDRPEAIQARMVDIRAAREATQPQRSRTAGSTFANPPGASAWRLIDAAGCRGLSRGGAKVSEKHCNFLLNLGNATAEDIESLGEEVRRRVLDTSGIDLAWEVRRIGEMA